VGVTAEQALHVGDSLAEDYEGRARLASRRFCSTEGPAPGVDDRIRGLGELTARR
jgi:FMN phosphatase YigB (HAD superfamily)